MKNRLLAVIRIRGGNCRREIRETLGFLRLHKKFHAVLVPPTPSFMGMLHKVKAVSYTHLTLPTTERV